MASLLATTPIKRIPSLANGDRVSVAEFERRYAAMPKNVRAELIEGMVYMAPPVRDDVHGRPHLVLANWLGHYIARTPGLLSFGDNSTVRLDNDNEVQPDFYLMLPAHAGGRAIIGADGYIVGAPALVCEIAASSVSIDLSAKKTAYRRNGVQEYLVWRTEDAAVDWFHLDGGEYLRISSQADGTLCSHALPGLCLNPATLLAGDLPGLFAMLHQSTGTQSHADFVAGLKPLSR